MLTYQLEKSVGKPLYESLYKAIRNDILKGNIEPKEMLPSKRSLASHLHISVTTVENAYAQLMLEGYIHAEHGRGFFVNELEFDTPTKSSIELEYGKALLSEPEEDDRFLVDFQANRSSIDLFPMSTWSKLMRNILTDKDKELLKVVPYNGIYSLRKAIADHLKKFKNMDIVPAQIIVGAGTEYLYTRILQLFNDSIFAIEDPGYKKFAEISGNAGVLWDYIPMDEEGMRIDRLEKSKANIVHVSPANQFPTGTVMPINRRIELLNWASKDNTRYIIEDDYDSELRYNGKMIPALYTLDNSNKVIYMNTFSKSLVPSIRISYMVLPPLLLDRYKKTLSFYSCTVSSFEQLTLANFISQGYFERHLNRLKQHYRDKRDQIVCAITNSKLSEVSRIEEADAGTHFLLRLNTEKTDEEIKMMAKEHKIYFKMLSDYEKHFAIKNSRTIVINYAGLDSEKINLAVKILEEMLCN